MTPGKIDVAPRTKNTLGEDLTPDAVVVLGQNFHVDDAVIDEHDISNGNVIDEPFIVDVDGMHILALRAANREFEDVARLKIEVCLQVPGADSRTLGIEQDASDDAEF